MPAPVMSTLREAMRVSKAIEGVGAPHSACPAGGPPRGRRRGGHAIPPHPAQRLGLRADTSFDDIVRAYLADNPGAGAG